MAGKVLREYPRMDLETNDVNVIREYLARNGGQKDYALPAELAKNPATGCAIFPWHGRRVTMICFNSGKPRNPATADLFLFITDQEALENPPVAVNPETNSVSGLKTTSWTSGRKVYLLASAETGQLNQ
jgi:hypothetical protein